MFITNCIIYVSVTYYIDTFNSFVNYYKPTYFYLYFPQDALPGRVIGTHFLNSNVVTDAVLAMLKPFSRSDTLQKVRLSYVCRLSVNTCGENSDTLREPHYACSWNICLLLR
jgi:hypothetical protein